MIVIAVADWLEIARRLPSGLCRAVTLLGLAAGIILGAGACASTPHLATLLPSAATTSSCDDRCASLSCPAGSRCELSSACAPSCQPEQLQHR
jgi:hypothetical protein